jgi:hypothetical protein
MKRLFLLTCVLLLVACSGSQETPEQPLRLGKDGVYMSFPDTNALELYEKDKFSVAVRLENVGANHITEQKPGWITASYDRAAFSFTEVATSKTRSQKLPVAFSLNGRDEFVTKGDVEFAEFNFVAQDVFGNRDKAQSTIVFNACYPYTTVFAHNVCIDRDVYTTQQAETCAVHTITDGSQGAPIAVTKVEPMFLREGATVTPRFRITVQNMQSGYTVWNPAATGEQLCTLSDFTYQEHGRAHVTASINNQPLKCGSDDAGIVRFERDTGVIVCSLPPLSAGASYEALLLVNVDYFYISSLTATVEVNNVS